MAEPEKTSVRRTWELPAVVFLTGAAVLIIEVSATRILSPFFGNSIFSLSSVLSVILAALSAGYYVGGRLADRRPEHKIFYMLIALGGLSVTLLRLLAAAALPMLGDLSLVWGPLVAAALLFFVPAFLLGMLSPFAVKLQSGADDKAGVGSAAGTIFFWSTLGSIAGSLSSGFFLIPTLGLASIMQYLSIFLVILGLAGATIHRGRNKKLAAAALVALLVLSYCSSALESEAESRYAYVKDGVYERLTVQNGSLNGGAARFFIQDRSMSGGMYLASDELLFDYTRYYTLYRLTKPDLESALFIGGGAYSMPKKLYADEPSARITVSEIEPSLERLAREYFKLPDDPRIASDTTDGRRLLRQSDARYDLIFSDVYNSLYSIPPHFTTKEFFELAKSRLTENGVLIANIIGRLSDDNPSFLKSEMRTFKEVFPESFFFAVDSPYSGGTQNFIFFGVNGKGGSEFGELATTAEGRQVALEFEPHLVDPATLALEGHALITDDYAPVEYFNASAFRGAAEAYGTRSFDGARALADIEKQVSFGSRSLRSPGHAAAIDHISGETEAAGLKVELQEWQHASYDGRTDKLTNIIASWNPDAERRIILGAHYDTRRYADQDPADPTAVMPGANDGASGVAVLLEIARNLRTAAPAAGVDLVFFDGEEGEEDLRAPWRTLGSERFASEIRSLYPRSLPKAAIVFDMVCDKDLKIYRNVGASDDPALQSSFWKIAAGLHPESFADQAKHSVLDDHVALAEAGVPSILLIDFDYPHFHTTKDTPDKCSVESLEAVGNAALEFVSRW